MKIQIKDMDLQQIHRSGQCFRWRQLEPGEYEIPAFGQTLLVKQKGDLFDFSCGEDTFEKIWRGYFDLNRDYGAIKKAVDPADIYLNKAIAFSSGVRVLRQEPWETIVSFIISQNNHIARIRKNIEALCRRYEGQLPSPAALAAEKPEKLRELGLGYRAEYLCAAGAFFKDERSLEKLAACPYPQAKQALQKIKGIGPKVADCICLFGLSHADAFPMDTHIKKILSENYPDGFPYERYKGYAGILQQYLFYYDLFLEKRRQAERA